MQQQDSAFAYHQSTAVGASAVGQVIALYDTILRDFRRVIAAIDAGQIAQRGNASNHALTIIGELQGVLDFERGGEAARNLNSFYNLTRAMTTEGCVTSCREKFLELISMFARLRAAWSHVEDTVARSEPTVRLRIYSIPQPTFSQNASVLPGSSEGPGNRGWKA